ncbi:MAG: hypothetical protein J0H06_03450 [Actinobacteria bacterium]|nr:hypothetical protein [Actinomycetota bacterium]OJU84816.1 MAG: hypothetical protein BGO11_03075 [Solirubrobacterales bacterium 70-9]
MNRRTLIPPALLLAVALTLTACGGGSSDEDKITEAIETAVTTSDPRNCTELETQRFAEQNSAEKGKVAVKTCEEEAKEGANKAKAANVSNVSVDGSKATADAEFEGGPLNKQTLELALVEEDGKWKMDQIEGFAKYDGAALAETFEKGFEEEGKGPSPEQASCITEGLAKASTAEAEELFLSGSPEKIIELAQGCA